MKIKRMIAITPLVLAIALLWGLQANAYFLVSGDGTPGDGNCNQCHSFTGANHDFHTGAGISCSTCHGDFSGQVETSVCSSCHGANDILQGHAGLQAPNGDYCGYCHEGVGAENHSWSEMRNIFE